MKIPFEVVLQIIRLLPPTDFINMQLASKWIYDHLKWYLDKTDFISQYKELHSRMISITYQEMCEFMKLDPFDSFEGNGPYGYQTRFCNKRHGSMVLLYGDEKIEMMYVDGKKHGKAQKFDRDGDLYWVKYYDLGTKLYAIDYFKNGNEFRNRDYVNGIRTYDDHYDPDDPGCPIPAL